MMELPCHGGEREGESAVVGGARDSQGEGKSRGIYLHDVLFLGHQTREEDVVYVHTNIDASFL